MSPPENPPLLELIDVARYFDVSAPWLNRMLERKPRQVLKAVDGVSFTIAKGETLGLVGESGCGKSTVARLIVGLYHPTRGTISFGGTRIDGGEPPLGLRRAMQMIFQDPYASLNPRWRVRDIIAEPIRAHELSQTAADVGPRGRGASAPRPPVPPGGRAARGGAPPPAPRRPRPAGAFLIRLFL